MTTATASTVGELFAAAVHTCDDGELTPTSKLKRRAIAATYATEIEGMYTGS